MRWTTFTFAPDEMASDAAVCRNACAVTRGNVGSAFSQRTTAPASQDSVDEGGPRYPPAADGQISSSLSLPSHVRASSLTTNAAKATVRALPDLSVQTIARLPMVTALRCSSTRRRRKVDILDAQSGGFPPPQTCGAKEQHQQPVSASLFGQPPQLVGG